MHELNGRWRDYKHRVIPRDAPAIQMVESRRAYFAGAAAIMDMVTRLKDAPALERQRELDDLALEIRQFQLEVRAERA